MSEHAALLQIDIVDSTKLGEALGDAAMSALWAEHDRMARDLLQDWHGKEIDKSDGFLLLFRDVDSATSYATAYQHRLSQLSRPLLARAGIHWGSVIVRKNLDSYVSRGAKPIEIDGLAKPLAARVMALASGGQVLLTGAARDEARRQATEPTSYGYWQIKGIDQPVELLEMGWSGAPHTPPRDGEKAYRVFKQAGDWIPARDIKHTVPEERDSFIGRRKVLRQLASEFASGARFVSLVGMGGMGKTRLATRYAKRWLGEFPGGAWFCDLAQSRTLDDVLLAVAQGLDIPLGQMDPRSQLAHALEGHNDCLLILDNFEQVVTLAQETIGYWFDRCPRARFLVTTRQTLGIRGERAIPVEPMFDEDAIDLFLQRARAVAPSFEASTVDRHKVNELARLLDGLPLAIELAAARSRVMSVETLLLRIGERFKLLASGDRGKNRQATLRTTFDWSWDLLPLSEKATLAQLAVFAGAFSLEAVEAVVDLGEADDAIWQPDSLQSLVNKSFVRSVGTERFELLESVREYAAEHLETEGRFPGSGPEARTRAEVRHGAFFSARLYEHVRKEDLTEIENQIAACRRAVARSDAPTAVGACLGAWELLRLRGPYRVAASLVELAQSVPGIAPTGANKLQFLRGRTLLMCGDIEGARVHLEAAVADARHQGNIRDEARSRSSLAELDMRVGRMEDAKNGYDAALMAGRDLQDPTLQCAALSGLGTYFNDLGQFQLAQEQWECALRLARASSDRRWEGSAIGNLGQLYANRGLSEQALDLYQEAVAIARSLGDRHSEGTTLCNLGLLNHDKGQEGEARLQLEASLSIARELGFPRMESVVLCNLGIVQEALGELDKARDAFLAAIDIARQRNDSRCEGQFVGYLGALLLRENRTVEALARLTQAVSLLRLVKDRVSLAIVLCPLAMAHRRLGTQSASRAAFAEAKDIALSAGVEAGSELALALDMAKADLE